MNPLLPLRTALCLSLLLLTAPGRAEAVPAHEPAAAAHEPAAHAPAGHAAAAAGSHGTPEEVAPASVAPESHESATPEPAVMEAGPAEHGANPAGEAQEPEAKPAPAHAAAEHAAEHPAAEHATASSPAALKELQGMLKMGASLTERGDYAAAEITYRQILDRHSFSKAEKLQGLLALAKMHRKQGTYIKAAAIYERFLKDYPEDPRTPEILLDLGRTLRAMGAHKLALSRFYSVINSTLKLNTESFSQYQLLARTAQFEIAETLYESGDFAEASKFFLRLRLLDLAPADRARAHFKAACAQRLNQDYETAVRTLRSYLEQWPDDENVPEARYLLAATLRQLNRSQEALTATLELLRATKKGDPRRWAYWQRRTGNQLANEFFQGGDTLNALAIYQGLITLAPEPAWRLPVLYQIALCYERLRQTDDARAAYTTICETLKNTPAGESGPTELSELARMAGWRLSQLAWHDSTERNLQVLFETTTGRKPAAPPPPPPHDPDGSTPTAPTAL